MIRLFVLLFIAFGCVGTAVADDDHDDDEHGRSFGSFFSQAGVAAVNNNLYKSNCAECHFAYQAGLLPKRSWQKLMSAKALENHFGDNAELNEADRLSILDYLVKNAADDANYKRSKKMMRSIRDSETPMRITKVRYFLHKHDELPARMVTGNSKVRSFSNCAACHTTANSGSYSERSIRIPNYGFWED